MISPVFRLRYSTFPVVISRKRKCRSRDVKKKKTGKIDETPGFRYLKAEHLTLLNR